MAPSLPPLTWFRTFEAAARTLSFTAAAEEIGMTQSAVSQQVKALETRLRTPLFDRRPRGLALTDEGRKLLPEVEAALQILSTATARHLPQAVPSALTVAGSVSVLEWVIAPRLPEFQASHPGTSITFLSTIWPDEFNRPRADIEIRFGSERQVGEGAVALPRELVAVGAPGCDLETAPLIEAVGTSVGWRSWLQAEGLAPRDPQLLVDSYGLALKLALEGAGAALVNAGVARNSLEAGLVTQLTPTHVLGNEAYFLVRHAAHPLASDFAAWVAAVMAA